MHRSIALYAALATLVWVGCGQSQQGNSSTSALAQERAKTLMSTTWKMDSYRSDLDTEQYLPKYSPGEQMMAKHGLSQMYFTEFVFGEEGQFKLNLADGNTLEGQWEMQDGGNALYFNTSIAPRKPYAIRAFSTDSIVLPADRAAGNLYTLVLVPMSATVTPPPSAPAPETEETEGDAPNDGE